jgi:3-methyl-2-oxobutanoate hydroxymethyltransferase
MTNILTPADIRACKHSGRKLVMLTAYDLCSAQAAVAGGVDLILVGDSLAMTVLGYPSTRDVTPEEMLHHTRAVVRGAQNTHVIGDLPAGTCDTPEQTVAMARRFIAAGCHSVKFEGPRPDVARALAAAGIAVVGHIGLTPQTAEKFTVQGKSAADQERLLAEARRLAAAGIFLLVVECVPAALGERITGAVNVPTVGIGAGPGCDGQVLVFNDLVGLFNVFKPKFVRRYAECGREMRAAVGQYAADVRSGAFPSQAESY